VRRTNAVVDSGSGFTRFPHSYTLFIPFSAATLYASANVG